MRWMTLFFVAACANTPVDTNPSATSSSGSGGGGGAGGAPTATLQWAPCPLYSGGAGEQAACATADVPAFWDDPGGPTIELFVKRIGDPNAPQQLWMLNGGPGASGADFEPLAEYLVSVDARLSIYLPDHRGTGRSTRLGCPDAEDAASPGGFIIEEEEWPACVSHLTSSFGEILQAFNTTAAAHDIGWLIEETRGPGQQAIVWGGSYGTRWLQRYLRLYPDQADALSMMGIAHPDSTFADYDARYDAVGTLYLARCSADAFCADKLGPDAAQKARDVLAMLDAGHCPELAPAGIDRGQLQRLFAYWLLWAWEERAMVPAILYRVERCAPGDIAALSYLGAALQAPVTPSIYDELQSTVLGVHIGLSEFWQTPSPTLAELEAVVANATFSLALGPRMRRRLDDWPVYAPDEHLGELGQTARPMLMLEGELDPATPANLAAEVGRFYSAPGQLYFDVPGAPHNWASPTATGTQCQLAMVFSFALDPAAPPYDCIGDILPLDFAGTPELAATYFGAADLWEDMQAAGPSAIAEDAPLSHFKRQLACLPF